VRLTQALDAAAFHFGRCAELVRIDQRKRPIADALHAQAMVLYERLPNFERLPAGKAQAPAHEELVPTARVGLGQHGVQSARVTMNVGDAEKAHATDGRSEGYP